jgi:hypothetical protein
MCAAPARTRRTRDRGHRGRPASQPVRLLAGVLGLALAGAGAAGCSPSSVSGLPSKATAVNELAARLDHGDGDPYQARYRLAGGGTATVSQATGPIRHAWSFSSATASTRFITTGSATSTCTAAAADPTGGGPVGAPASCTLTAPPKLNDQPDLAAVFRASDRRFVSAQQLMSLLTDASLHGATVRGHRATVAGRSVYCATSSGGAVPGFTGCLTRGGALARFAGTVDGGAVDVELTDLTTAVPADVFEAPPGATVLDRRSGQ